MRQPLFIQSSDWHLERNAWIRHPDLSGDAYYSLKQVIDLCLTYKTALLAPGDLFDKPFPDPKSVRVAMAAMDTMQRNGLQVYFTQGQHERNVEQPWLGLHEWPKHIHDLKTNHSGICITGLDYQKPYNLKYDLSIAEGSDIFLCHQVWRDFMGKYVNTDGEIADIPVTNAIIATGDYHKHVQLKVNSNTVLSSGSLCLQSIDEPPDKFVYLIYDDLTYESLPIKTRSVFYKELHTEQDFEAFIDTLELGWLEPRSDVPSNISRPILSIKYNAEIPDLYSRLTEAIHHNRAHLFIRPMNKEITVKQVNVDECAATTIDLGLVGNLAKLCDQKSDTYEIAQKLLLSANMEQELLALEDKYLNASKPKEIEV